MKKFFYIALTMLSMVAASVSLTSCNFSVGFNDDDVDYYIDECDARTVSFTLFTPNSYFDSRSDVRDLVTFLNNMSIRRYANANELEYDISNVRRRLNMIASSADYYDISVLFYVYDGNHSQAGTRTVEPD